MLALSSFFGEISGEGWFPKADVLSGIEERITEIARTSFLHAGVGIGCVHLAGLVSRGREAGISQDLVRRIEAGEVSNLSEDHGSHAVADAGDREDRRSHLVDDRLDGYFNLVNLLVQLPDELNGMTKLQRLGRHP